MKRLLSIAYWLIIIILTFLIAMLSWNALNYFNFNTSFGFLKLKESAIATGWYLPFYYSHVLAAGIILLVGFFQLLIGFRPQMRQLHKLMGTVYAYGIIFLAAPGGLIMSFFIDRGAWVLLSFLLQTVLWLICTILAVQKARKGDITSHRKWMLRSYTLTFAAVTLRLYIFIVVDTIDLTHPSAYGIIAWLSWIINLLAVEFYLIYKSNIDSP